ncbi:ribonuclease D [Agaribacterium haliotis]|uniref:ribonuclease D n=1 Tax=Agaribacterium haliotis TaxID=2013869 RepID=UPI000BB52DC1|nr:ribonuclease D [Agaribacterium haliotis]
MSDSLLKQPVHWVDSDAELERLCDSWQNTKLLALDTEFIRTSTYYPIAGLLQLNDGQATYLVDPTCIDDWYPLIELLDDKQRIIAMHACSEDLEVLQQCLGCIPAQIFDTQVAIAFAGGAASMGYAALVEQELGLALPKAETRSDWLQRPLSKAQLMYAALDVEYLFELAQLLFARLEQQHKLDWVLEDARRQYRQFKANQQGRQAVDRIKNSWKLIPRKLAALQRLADWRENLAQMDDVPRNRVIKEGALYELALSMPKHISQLRKIEGISDRIVRKHGEHIVELIAGVEALPDDQLPEPLPKPLNKSEREKLQALRAFINAQADNLAVAPELIFRKKDCERILRLAAAESWQPLEAMLQGWREQQLGSALRQFLKEL